LCGGENREKGWTGIVYLLKGDCEGSPDLSEVSSLGKQRSQRRFKN